MKKQPIAIGIDGGASKVNANIVKVLDDGKKFILSKNNSVKELAESYLEEMGGFHATFGVYKGKWDTAKRIQEAPDEFIQDTTKMFAVLLNRIKKEDTELYDLVDKL